MTSTKKKTVFTAAVLLALLAACLIVDMTLPSYHIVVTVIKKATVYSLVAVSMNLLNGFTGLFSLGQAGFMLLGAYAYAVLTIPVDKRPGVYQYFDGGALIIGICENIIKGLPSAWDVSVFSDAFTFALLILVLVFKPTGLFGEKVTDKV